MGNSSTHLISELHALLTLYRQNYFVSIYITFFTKNAKKYLNMITTLLELFKIFFYVAVSIVPKLLSSY